MISKKEAVVEPSSFLMPRCPECCIVLRLPCFFCATVIIYNICKIMDKILCISSIIVAILYQFVPVNSLSFTLSSGATKCLKEELHKDVLVTGEYQLSEANQKTHLTV